MCIRVCIHIYIHVRHLDELYVRYSCFCDTEREGHIERVTKEKKTTAATMLKSRCRETNPPQYAQWFRGQQICDRMSMREAPVK
jgi:hypothetical protein